MKTLVVVLLLSVFVWGQNKPVDQGSMPSKEEVSELVAKADEKVSSFEEAVKHARPYLDKINPKFATNYLDGASTAHTIIHNLKKKSFDSATRLDVSSL